jgi:hypothetical protein
VWVQDKLSFQLSAVPKGTDPISGNPAYLVTITAHGSFAATSEPNTGACYTGTGSVNSWLTYEVSSPTAPSSDDALPMA